MKIALVAPSYLPARRANTLQVMKMAQAFTQLGHDVCVYIPRHVGMEKKQPVWDDIAHHYGLRLRFEMVWMPALSWMRSYDFGFRAIQKAHGWGARLIYTRLPQAAALGSLLGVNTILEVHDLPRGRFGTRLFNWFLKGQGATRLVVITRALRDDLIKSFDVPESSSFTLVAPDGVDLSRYAGLPIPREARDMLKRNNGLSIPPERFTIGYTGHLYPGRGIDIILSLAVRLPEYTFLLVGGEREAVARVRAESVGMHNVLVTGFVPNAELPLYQAGCDLLLMPYQQQVAASSGGDIARYLSPMKVFEYMASGRAILSSDLPVLREVLNSENSVMLPPEDIEAWVQAIHELLGDTDRRESISTQARHDARNYTWESRAKRILDSLE